MHLRVCLIIATVLAAWGCGGGKDKGADSPTGPTGGKDEREVTVSTTAGHSLQISKKLLEHSRILFTDGDDAIYQIRPDGSDKKKIHQGDRITSLSWAPDGSKILVATYSSGFSNFYLLNPDGSGQTQVTQGYDPVWSPSGQYIACTYKPFFPEESPPQVFLVDAKNIGERLLAEGHAPAWSPDSRQLAFLECETLQSPYDFSDYKCVDRAVDLISVDGMTRQTAWRITDEANSSRSFGDWLSAGILYWVPNSQKVLAVWASNAYEIQVDSLKAQKTDFLGGKWSPDGSKVLPLGRTTVWSPDGSKLAFLGDNGVEMMDPDGSNRVTLLFEDTSPDGLQIAWSPFLP